MAISAANEDIGYLQRAERYQEVILEGVSRTFALTIPQLPGNLRRVVTNAYLLCRIADTIEDDPAIGFEETRKLHDEFIDAAEGKQDIDLFVARVEGSLSEASSPDEHDLIHNTALVLAVTDSFSSGEKEAVIRCIRIMCAGMPEFQKTKSLLGLPDVAALNSYCYYVAGVVGEMLTDLFCIYSPQIERRREALMAHAVSFGQGLQMTNIIKDIYEDRAEGCCWLPRDVFQRAGFDLAELKPGCDDWAFAQGLDELIGIALEHLRNALSYTLLIPTHENGIRKFCLWAIGLAVLTLRKIEHNKSFASGSEVKLQRRTVQLAVLTTGTMTKHDGVLKALFDATSLGMPSAGSNRFPYAAHTPRQSRTG